jgi:hypothetical protein
MRPYIWGACPTVQTKTIHVCCSASRESFVTIAGRLSTTIAGSHHNMERDALREEKEKLVTFLNHYYCRVTS